VLDQKGFCNPFVYALPVGSIDRRSGREDVNTYVPRLVSLAFAAALAVACGSNGSAASSPPTPTPAPAVVKSALATVDGKSETILTDANGMTLYYYMPDKGTGKVNCVAACLQNWPPLLLSAGITKPVGGKGVVGILGTVPNPNGGTQVTYNGWPMYTWSKDKVPGDTTGQNLGGKWFVFTPDVPSGS
jgi:predicted lipoprotein with Yx(FWY)xxD motif